MAKQMLFIVVQRQKEEKKETSIRRQQKGRFFLSLQQSYWKSFFSFLHVPAAAARKGEMILKSHKFPECRVVYTQGEKRVLCYFFSKTFFAKLASIFSHPSLSRTNIPSIFSFFFSAQKKRFGADREKVEESRAFLPRGEPLAKNI